MPMESFGATRRAGAKTRRGAWRRLPGAASLLTGVAAFLIAWAPAARADVVTLTFSAADFSSGSPVSSVSGQIVWTAASLIAPIDALVSIDLNVAGHPYTVSELGFGTLPSGVAVWGLPWGSGLSAANDADDFKLVFDPATSSFIEFTIAVAGYTSAIWTADSGDVSLRIEEGTVSEPGTFALVGATLLALAVPRRRAPKQKSM